MTAALDPAQARATWPLVIEYVEQNAPTLTGLFPRPDIIATVVADMRARHDFGMAHYGVPLAVGVKEDNLFEAYAEALDQAVYLRTDYEAQHDREEQVASWRLFERAVECAVEIRRVMLRRAQVPR